MTLSQFICIKKSIKDILEFCKEIEGLESEHGSLAIAGVPNTKTTPSVPKSNRDSRKRKRKSTSGYKTDVSDSKSDKYCPIHGYGSHTAEECILLKTAISNGKKSYLSRKKQFKPNDKKSYSKQEVSVMIHSCLLYTSPSPRDRNVSRMPSSA